MSNLKEKVAAKAEAATEPPTESGVVDLAENDQALRWLLERRTYFAEALPRHVDEYQFIQAASLAMRDRYVAACTPQSLTAALMQCARFGLDPDGVHAAIVPYGQTATFIPMYQGYIELMYRSGRVDAVVFDFIREGDEWGFDQGRRAPEDFFHRPNLINPGQPLIAYAFAWMRGGARSQIVFQNRAKAEEIRDTRSKAYQQAEQKRREDPKGFERNPTYGKYSSPWHTDFEAMWAKGPVRRLNKRVPTSPEIRELVKADVSDDLLVERVQPVRLALPSKLAAQVEAPGKTAEPSARPAPDYVCEPCGARGQHFEDECPGGGGDA